MASQQDRVFMDRRSVERVADVVRRVEGDARKTTRVQPRRVSLGSGGNVSYVVIRSVEEDKIRVQKIRPRDDPPQPYRFEVFGDPFDAFPAPGSWAGMYEPFVWDDDVFTVGVLPCIAIRIRRHTFVEVPWRPHPRATLDATQPHTRPFGD